MNSVIAVCIATYRRPQMLRQTLRSVLQQKVNGYTISIRVVDNDPELSAYPVVSTMRQQAHRDICYAAETSQNIASARNRALRMGPTDLVAFIDDDEVASEGWLNQMVRVLHNTGADAVFGPVDGRVPNEASDWIKQSGMFTKNASDTVTDVHWRDARTSNALVKGTWLFESGYRFDPQYGCSGGEDTELFSRIYRDGARFVWSPESVVEETVPANRATLSYLWRRRYHSGKTYNRILAGQNAHRPFRQLGCRLTALLLLTWRGLTSPPDQRANRMAQIVIYTGLIMGGVAGWLGREDNTATQSYAQTQSGH